MPSSDCRISNSSALQITLERFIEVCLKLLFTWASRFSNHWTATTTIHDIIVLILCILSTCYVCCAFSHLQWKFHTFVANYQRYFIYAASLMSATVVISVRRLLFSFLFFFFIWPTNNKKTELNWTEQKRSHKKKWKSMFFYNRHKTTLNSSDSGFATSRIECKRWVFSVRPSVCLSIFRWDFEWLLVILVVKIVHALLLNASSPIWLFCQQTRACMCVVRLLLAPIYFCSDLLSSFSIYLAYTVGDF